jgi:class 3 adenylate cyclase
MTAADLPCKSCGTLLNEPAKFCSECGAAVSASTSPAEYKQVSILFADVVHSMDIAAAVGAERLREIMAALADRAAAVVKRYGGTVDKFTGDGIMAVFGAPVALEDHAVRACLAALSVQQEAKRLAVDIEHCDGVDLRIRVGLNSGEVIAGEIGSGRSPTRQGLLPGMSWACPDGATTSSTASPWHAARTPSPKSGSPPMSISRES